MTKLDHTHDPAATSWVEGADDHAEFPVQNLPLGVFSTADGTPRGGVAIGDFVCDLGALEHLLTGDAAAAARLASGATLNALVRRWQRRRGRAAPGSICAAHRCLAQG